MQRYDNNIIQLPNKGVPWGEDKRLTRVVPDATILLASSYTKDPATPGLVALARSADLDNFV